MLEDGQVLDVTNVIWCTGFRHDLSWIDLPIFDESGEPLHERGVVDGQAGPVLRRPAVPVRGVLRCSPGVGRDAAYVVKHLVAERATSRSRSAAAA